MTSKITSSEYNHLTNKLSELGIANLQEYCKSSLWTYTKKMVRGLRKRKEECYCCGQGYKLNLHHKTYKRLGHELPCDLVWLCKNCHKLVHDLVKEGKSSLWMAADVLKHRTKKEDLKLFTKDEMKQQRSFIRRNTGPR